MSILDVTIEYIDHHNYLNFFYYKSLVHSIFFYKCLNALLEEYGVLFGIKLEENALGFFFCQIDSAQNLIISFYFIKEEYRKKQLGKRCFEFIVKYAQEHQHEKVLLQYFEDDPLYMPIQHYAERFHFEKTNRCKYVFSLSASMEKKLHFITFMKTHYQKLLKVPDSMRLIQLNNLAQNELQQIEAGKHRDYHSVYYPFADEHEANREMSLFLFNTNDPVAWITVKQYGQGSILIDKFYIKPEYRRTGLPVLLIYHSLKILPKEIKYISFYVLMKNKMMNKVIDRFMIFDINKKKEMLVKQFSKNIKMLEEQ